MRRIPWVPPRCRVRPDATPLRAANKAPEAAPELRLIAVIPAISRYSIPAKAGTHRSDIPEFSSSGNTSPVREGSAAERWTPAVRRGGERIGDGGILRHARSEERRVGKECR